MASESGNLTTLTADDKTVYLLGTAHVSKKSVEEVKQLIAEIEPDVVCIELCKARYSALTDENRWRSLDIFKVIKEGKTLFLLANLAIGAYQRRLGAELGVTPGAEFLAAAEHAKTVGAKVELVDREINITLKRTWRGLPFSKKTALIGAIMQSLVARGGDGIQAADIERLKESPQLSEMLDELTKVLPEVATPLIDERNRYMMTKIERCEGKKVLAVVGAGHVPGMKALFGQPSDLEPLERIPPPSRIASVLKWVIPALILCAFAWGFYKNQGRTLAEMLYAWVLPNSVVAALLTIVAGGKPLSVLTAFVASPITSLNPLLGAGMIVGLVEAWRRRPTVQDAENINHDVQSLRGVYKNPFTRVLLVAVMSSLGSAIGAWIGAAWVVSLI
ncbi:MAG: TraB/GumN family protein [Deltaproteobacteria bacterium]|nr:TraB/GumN family protein [Deltaproteobacteria bacterium]